MRQAAFAVLVVVGLLAYAQEGALLEPRVHVPGERAIEETITVSDKVLDAWDLTGADRDAVKKEVERLNGERQSLIKELKTEHAELGAAQKKVNDTLAKLDQQSTAFASFLEKMVGADKAKGYTIRAQLQPVIDWLKLTDDQVKQLIDKQRALLAEDPRQAILEGVRRSRDIATAGPPGKEERNKQIATLKKYMDFNKQWLGNIRSVLTPEQQQVWDTRYRRSQVTPEGGT